MKSLYKNKEVLQRQLKGLSRQKSKGFLIMETANNSLFLLFKNSGLAIDLLKKNSLSRFVNWISFAGERRNLFYSKWLWKTYHEWKTIIVNAGDAILTHAGNLHGLKPVGNGSLSVIINYNK